MAVRKVYRTTVDLAEISMASIQHLSKKRGKSPAQIIRDAIATEQYLQDAVDAGGKVLIERRDHSLRQLFIK